MKFHDDLNKAFKPILDHVERSGEEVDKTVGKYMYMFHDDEKTHYKHFGTREYFNIYHDGETEGTLENWRKWI